MQSGYIGMHPNCSWLSMPWNCDRSLSSSNPQSISFTLTVYLNSIIQPIPRRCIGFCPAFFISQHFSLQQKKMHRIRGIGSLTISQTEWTNEKYVNRNWITFSTINCIVYLWCEQEELWLRTSFNGWLSGYKASIASEADSAVKGESAEYFGIWSARERERARIYLN